MSEFPLDWEGLSGRVKKSELLSRFRQKFLQTLISHGREFEICGMHKAAKAQFEKIEKQLGEKLRHSGTRKPEGDLNFNRVEENYFKHSLEDMLKVLVEEGGDIPKAEKELLREQVKKLNNQSLVAQPKTSQVAHKKFSTLQRDRLHSLRLTLLNKVTRYKLVSKRSHNESFVEKARFPEVVGTYNNRFNICEALDLLQDADAILVEDLKEHYSQVAKLSVLF